MEKELEVVVVAEPKKIGLDEIRRADTILQSYKDGKKNLENRIISNERWWKMRHWEQIRNAKTDIEPSSAWMFNALANKHADAMDNYPQPNVLPREESDQATAERTVRCRTCTASTTNQAEQAEKPSHWVTPSC